MPELSISSEEQIGGFKLVRLITLDEIVFCPGVLTNQNASTFLSSPTLETIDALFVGERINIRSTQRRNKSGLLHSISAEFELEKQSSDLDDYLNKHANKPLVMIGEKQYGQQILYGSENAPLKLLYKNAHGKKPEDGSIVRVKISGKISQKPVFITN